MFSVNICHIPDLCFQVEKILSRRRRSKRTEYLIRWRGYSNQFDTWEPEANLRLCWEVVNNFNRKYGHSLMKKPSPQSLRVMKAQKVITAPYCIQRSNNDHAKSNKKKAVSHKNNNKQTVSQGNSVAKNVQNSKSKSGKKYTALKRKVVTSSDSSDSDTESDDGVRYMLGPAMLEALQKKSKKAVKRKIAPSPQNSKPKKQKTVTEDDSEPIEIDTKQEAEPSEKTALISAATKFVKSESRMEVKSLSPSDNKCSPGCELNVRKFKVLPQTVSCPLPAYYPLPVKAEVSSMNLCK